MHVVHTVPLEHFSHGLLHRKQLPEYEKYPSMHESHFVALEHILHGLLHW